MAGSVSAGCHAPELATAAKAACDQTYPALTGRVVDQADLLTPAQETALTATLASFEAKTKHQMAVATVTTLQNKPVDAYSMCLANHWALGRKGQDDGLMFLIAPKERKARIEVGSGLEAALTNAEAQVIMDEVIVPQFREGHMVEGIDAGVSAIIKEAS